MIDHHEVISAFLDDEPVDAGQLAQALSDPEGRAQLIDLVVLRHVMQPANTSFEPKRRPSALRALAAAAAIAVALAGGYFAGQSRSDAAHGQAPPATRVVEAAAEWQVLP
jgi:hypothetical protein